MRPRGIASYKRSAYVRVKQPEPWLELSDGPSDQQQIYASFVSENETLSFFRNCIDILHCHIRNAIPSLETCVLR